MIPLTRQQLLQILPNAGPVAGVFVSALNDAMTRFKIDGATCATVRPVAGLWFKPLTT